VSSVPVRLVKGADDVLRGEALTRLIAELVGDGDRSLLVDEIDLDAAELGAAVDAAQTPPFLTERRIVVIRHFGRFSKADELTGLLAYLEDPLPSTDLVLVWERSNEPSARVVRIPPTLTKAIKAAGGEVVDTDAPGGRGLSTWIGEQFAAAGLDVEPRARDRVVGLLGEDAGGVVGLINRLTGAFGTGQRLRLDDIEPFLGEAGGVPPWDLTDAIDQGDVPLALDRLRRMMTAGDRHALAVMATLQSHYLRMLRLDGSGVRTEKDAAAVLGLKGSTFPAKKALAQSKRLGGAGVRRAVQLLAEADVDLRGAQAWPGELVMEVLVARLARASRPARAGR
jgi:DNA polymerase-3 subunit delta